MKTINTFYDDYAGLHSFVKTNHACLFNPDVESVMVQIFSGQCNKRFLENVSSEIRRLVPHANIIGTTTSGGIMDGQVSGLKTVLSFSIFQHSGVRVGSFPKSDKDDFELGQWVARTLGSDNAKILILFSTRESVNANTVFQGIRSVYPNLPIAGGNAGNNFSNEQGMVLVDGQVITSGIAGVVLEGYALVAHCYSHLGWQPIGKEMVITKSQGSRVYTIDGLPAYEIYSKYLGLGEKEFHYTFEYPLITERHGVQIARTPFRHYEDKSIEFAGELIAGEKVKLSFGDVGMISTGVAELCVEIKDAKPESIYVYSCESRRGFLQEHSKIETEPLQKIAPAAGFFTHGEFFHADSANQLLNATMTVLALSEHRDIEDSKAAANLTAYLHKAGGNCVDKVVERSTGVLKSLAHLVNKVTSELVETNERLKYMSLHDALTGLYNRAAFEHEMKNAESYEGQVGVIVCDLDFLKILNDVLGHSIGDKALILASEAITKACPEADMIARIGGDEFAVIIRNADMTLLIDLRDRISVEVARLRELHPELPLYLSAGVAVKSRDGDETINQTFKAADKDMYFLKFDAQPKVRKAILDCVKT